MMPVYVKKILAKLTRAGFGAWAVGGCVRDTLLNRRPKDWDIASSASADEVERLFRKTAPTGIRYGTVTVFSGVGSCELTTLRADGSYSDGRRPESVSFVGSLAEDLSRRDFTVNAMAMDASGEMTDIFGGREDLEARLLRAVGDPERRFSEDALRMLRCLRFSAELGFAIEPATLAAVKKLAPKAAALSAERVRDEVGRMLRSPRPEKLDETAELGLLARFGVNGGDFSRLRHLPKRGDGRWCAFAALSGGGAELLRALRLPGKTVKLCEAALRAAESYRGNDRELLAEFGPDTIMAAGCVLTAKGIKNDLRTETLRGGYVSENDLAISGAVLMEMGFSGPALGELKRELAKKVTLGEAENRAGDLIRLIEGRG